MQHNQRTIEFRAWTVDRGMLWPPFNLFIKQSMAMLMQEGGYFGYHGSSVTLLQLTGLKDKHGTDIYEDDLVRGDDGSLWLVAWDFNQTAFVGSSLDDDVEDYVPLGQLADDRKFEVIGNIYENPELLEQA